MKHLVIIGMVFPEPKSTAAGKRMMQIMDFFKQENYHISFLCAANNFEFSENLSQQNINCIHIELNHGSFDELIQVLNPDIVIFDRFVTEEQYGWKVAENCPNALRILDTEDLHFLRKSRELAYKKGKSLDENWSKNDIFKREMAAIFRCDLTLIISEFEWELLQNKFGVNPEILCYFPLLATNEIDVPFFKERKNFVSIGNFLHEPNWHTVLQLKKIWPEIRKKLPNAEMHIYGAYPTEKAQQLHNSNDGFLIKGRATAVEEIFRDARLLLAPIPFGAGIKGKLLDAMRCGLPSITTEIGAEAMHGKMPWNGRITKNNEEFVAATIELYNDENLWQQAQKNGFELVEKRYNKNIFYPQLSSIIHRILMQIDLHREKNYWGQILMHHTLQSTKYLGKWIEEKNKKIGNNPDFNL